MPKQDKVESKLDPKVAAEALEKDKLERQKAATAKVEAALKEFNCRIDVAMMVSARGAEPIIRVVAI